MDSDIEGPSGQGLNPELQKTTWGSEIQIRCTPATATHREWLEKALTAPAKLFVQQNTGTVSWGKLGWKVLSFKMHSRSMIWFWTCNLLLSFIWILHLSWDTLCTQIHKEEMLFAVPQLRMLKGKMDMSISKWERSLWQVKSSASVTD